MPAGPLKVPSRNLHRELCSSIGAKVNTSGGLEATKRHVEIRVSEIDSPNRRSPISASGERVTLINAQAPLQIHDRQPRWKLYGTIIEVLLLLVVGPMAVRLCSWLGLIHSLLG